MSIPLVVVLDDWGGEPGCRTVWAKTADGYVVQVTADVTLFSTSPMLLCKQLENLDPGPGRPEGDSARPARQQDPCPQYGGADSRP